MKGRPEFPYTVGTNVPRIHKMKQWCLENVGTRYDHIERAGAWKCHMTSKDIDGYINPHSRTWWFMQEEHYMMFTLRWL